MAQFSFDRITNNNRNVLVKENVFYMSIKNNSNFEVKIVSRTIGEIIVSPNETKVFNGHPTSTVQHISLKVLFNTGAGINESVDIITSYC